MDPYEELRRLKSRLAELELIAARPPRAGIGDAIADAMAKPPPTRRERDLANLAHFHDPAAEAEAAFQQRSKDPERYDRELAAMGGDLLGQAIGRAGREAFIKLGGKIPDPEEE